MSAKESQMIIHQCDQGTERWYQLRRGVPTASSFDKIITPAGKPSSQATGYRNRLIAERLLGRSIDEMDVERHDGIYWVRHGRTWESRAADKLAAKIGRLEPVGFITTDDGRLGCSPDRLCTGKHKGEAVEIKCPAPWTQIGYLLDGPGEAYRAQVQGQLLIGEFDCIHFFAYHSWMPPVHIVTYRDEAYLAKLVPLLYQFLEELERETARARSLGVYQVTDDWPEESTALRAPERSVMQ